MSPNNAQNLIKDKGVTIIDVRTPEEFSGGHIRRARLVPLASLESEIDTLLQLKDKPILVYCRSGARSNSASQILRNHGFTGVQNLSGGISAWQGAGFQIEH